jgi:hypothetical protein
MVDEQHGVDTPFSVDVPAVCASLISLARDIDFIGQGGADIPFGEGWQYRTDAARHFDRLEELLNYGHLERALCYPQTLDTLRYVWAAVYNLAVRTAVGPEGQPILCLVGEISLDGRFEPEGRWKMCWEGVPMQLRDLSLTLESAAFAEHEHPAVSLIDPAKANLVATLGMTSEKATSFDYGHNEERDRWLYEQWHNNRKSWQSILKEFPQVRASKDWSVVSTINGVRAAAESYANFHRLAFRKGKAGRPRKKK